MSFASLVGALLFLGIGVLEVAFVNRSLYQGMRWRYEEAKLTQQQGIDPDTIMLLVKIQSFVLMPLVGFLLGGRVKSIFG